MIPVELAPDVTASLRAMKDRGTPPPRCHSPGGERIAFRGVDDHWRLIRFAVDEILAEEVKNEISDGATPYSTYVRGVIVDGDRGVLLTGRDDSALIIEG